MPPIILPLGHRRRGNGTSIDQVGNIQNALLLVQQFGRDLYVDSNKASGVAGAGGSWEDALLTVGAATALAISGDRVHIAPGHAESISAAGGVAFSKAGVSYYGYGNGARRPTFTFTAVAATMTFTAANVYVSNIVLTATAAATSMVSVTAAGVTLDGVDYVEGSAVPLQFLLTSAAADQLTIKNCYHVAVTAGASAQAWIALVGPDDTTIVDNVFHLALNNAAASFTIRASTAAIRVQIHRNRIVQTGGTTQVAALSLVANSTGYVTDNRIAANVTTLAGVNALASAYGAENYCSHTVNKNGILDPGVDT